MGNIKNKKDLAFRLRDWSRKYPEMFRYLLGIPSKNLIQKYKEQGGIHVKGTAPHHFHSYPEAEEVEKAINALAGFDARASHVLREFYLEVGTAKDKSEKLGIKSAQFSIELEKARYFVAGRLLQNCNPERDENDKHDFA